MTKSLRSLSSNSLTPAGLCIWIGLITPLISLLNGTGLLFLIVSPLPLILLERFAMTKRRFATTLGRLDDTLMLLWVVLLVLLMTMYISTSVFLNLVVLMGDCISIFCIFALIYLLIRIGLVVSGVTVTLIPTPEGSIEIFDNLLVLRVCFHTVLAIQSLYVLKVMLLLIV